MGWPSPWLAQAVPHVHVHMESRLWDISRQAAKSGPGACHVLQGDWATGLACPQDLVQTGHHTCAVVLRRYHDHVVAVVSRLVEGIRAKGSAAAIDVSDISQRESFDVIGMVRLLRPQKHKACAAHMAP